MAPRLIQQLLFVVLVCTSTNAFISNHHLRRKHHPPSLIPTAITTTGSKRTSFATQRKQNQPLWGSSSSSDPPSSSSSSSGGDAFPWERNKARTDIRMFLTQRSIQSFVYLLNQCREEHTIQYLEKSLDFTNIDKYHGTGAFNQTMFPKWDSIFLDYVDRPEEVIVMTVKQRQRRRSSLSGHNSYLENMAPPKTSPLSSGPAATKKPRPLAGTNNYLDNMSKPASPDDSSTASKDEPQSSSTTPKAPPRGMAGNYLESLSSVSNTLPSANSKPPSSASTSPTNPSRGFPGNYLDSLSSNNAQPSMESNGVRKPMGDLAKNPFVEEKTIDYELEVDPSAVVRRILAVREQISQEWIQDLDMLMQLNDEIMERYEEYMETQAEGAMEDDDDEEDDPPATMESSADNIKGDTEDAKDRFTPYLDTKSVADASSSIKTPIFDINAWYAWSQSLFSKDRDSSPFRRKNFDLLLLLSTQESIHRVLKTYKEDKSVRPETYEWLLDFYKDRAGKYFDGHQAFGRAEEFLQEMLQSPPVVIETDTKALGVLAWINPARIAEDIVRERSEVALYWMNVAQSIPEEHTDLRRLLFTNSFSKAESETSSVHTIILAAADEQDVTNPTIGAFEYGAFE